MRAMVVEADILSALRMRDALAEVGFNIVGPARSSGEALVLAKLESPDIVVLGMDLEVSGAGGRLADRLKQDLQIPSVMTNEHAPLQENTHCGRIVELALQRRRRPT